MALVTRYFDHNLGPGYTGQAGSLTVQLQDNALAPLTPGSVVITESPAGSGAYVVTITGFNESWNGREILTDGISLWDVNRFSASAAALVPGVPVVDVRYVNGEVIEAVDRPFAMQGIYLAVMTNPRYQTRDLPPIAQGSEPTEIWNLTDPTGAPIDLSGKAIRFVAYLRTDKGVNQESIYDDTITPSFKYETGDGITLIGPDDNQVELKHEASRTGVPGLYEYVLWNATDKLVLAKGRCPIEPLPFDA